MRDNTNRLIRSIRGLPDSPAVPLRGDNADPLARELSARFVEDLREQRRAGAEDSRRLGRHEREAEDRHRITREKAADRVTFNDLEDLSRDHPDEALAKWEQVKAAARGDVANGWHAARGVGDDAWDRACFLAIRDEFRATWPPRTAVEAMLIDEMTQYELARRKYVRHLWLGMMVFDDRTGSTYTHAEEAGRIVDRLQRSFQHALRTLIALRRTTARPVVSRVETAPAIDCQIDSGEPAPVADETP